MAKFTNPLDEIVSDYAAVGWNLRANLQPGLSQDEIERITGSLNFKLSPSLIELYMWRNGAIATANNPADSFLYGFRFLSLEESIASYNVGIIEIPSLQHGWLPFMIKGRTHPGDDHFDEGDAFVAECVARSQAIRLLKLDKEESPTVCQDMARTFRAIRDCIRRKSIYVDDGRWVANDEAVWSAISRMSPGADASRRRQDDEMESHPALTKLLFDRRDPDRVLIVIENARGGRELRWSGSLQRMQPKYPHSIFNWVPHIEITPENAHEHAATLYPPLSPAKDQRLIRFALARTGGQKCLIHSIMSDGSYRVIWEGTEDQVPPMYQQQIAKDGMAPI